MEFRKRQEVAVTGGGTAAFLLDADADEIIRSLFTFQNRIGNNEHLVLGVERAKRLLRTKHEYMNTHGMVMSSNFPCPIGFVVGKRLAEALRSIPSLAADQDLGCLASLLGREWTNVELELRSQYEFSKDRSWIKDILRDSVLFAGCHLLAFLETDSTIPQSEVKSRIAMDMISNWDRISSSSGLRSLCKLGQERRTLFLVAKVPTKGHCKTRLAKGISSNKAEEFARACILDLCEHVAKIEEIDDRVLLFAPAEDRDVLEELLSSNLSVEARQAWTLVPFRTEEASLNEEASSDDILAFNNGLLVGLGRGLARALHDLKKQTQTGRAVFIGMDTPHLGTETIKQAFSKDWDDRGSQAMVVPAKDGGYVLLGVNYDESMDIRESFSNIAWSTNLTLAMQVAALNRAGFSSVAVDSEIYQDVDDLVDMLALIKHLDGSASGVHCPRVKAFLDGHCIGAISDEKSSQIDDMVTHYKTDMYNTIT